MKSCCQSYVNIWTPYQNHKSKNEACWQVKAYLWLTVCLFTTCKLNGTCTSLFFTIILNFILHNEEISADLPMYMILYASWWQVLSDFDIRIMISYYIYFYIIKIIPLRPTKEVVKLILLWYMTSSFLFSN